MVRLEKAVLMIYHFGFSGPGLFIRETQHILHGRVERGGLVLLSETNSCSPENTDPRGKGMQAFRGFEKFAAGPLDNQVE